MKSFAFAAACLTLCFVTANSSWADSETGPSRYAGCYSLTLTPIRLSDPNAEAIRNVLPKKFQLKSEKQPNQNTLYVTVPNIIQTRLTGSWMLQDDRIRVQWGDGYGFAIIELHLSGDDLEGRAGGWSDDGGRDTWTDKASAKRVACDDSFASEPANQGIPSPTASAP